MLPCKPDRGYCGPSVHASALPTQGTPRPSAAAHRRGRAAPRSAAYLSLDRAVAGALVQPLIGCPRAAQHRLAGLDLPGQLGDGGAEAVRLQLSTLLLLLLPCGLPSGWAGWRSDGGWWCSSGQQEVRSKTALRHSMCCNRTATHVRVSDPERVPMPGWSHLVPPLTICSLRMASSRPSTYSRSP